MVADFLKTAAFIIVFMFLWKYTTAKLPDGPARRGMAALVS